MQALAGPAVRFEPPHRGLQQCGGIAVAVHEDDGRRLGLAEGGAVCQGQAGGSG